MSEDGGSRSELQVVYNVDRILDCHTHLTGQERAEQVLECLDACGVEDAFVFALMLNAQARDHQRQHPRHPHSQRLVRRRLQRGLRPAAPHPARRRRRGERGGVHGERSIYRSPDDHQRSETTHTVSQGSASC